MQTRTEQPTSRSASSERSHDPHDQQLPHLRPKKGKKTPRRPLLASLAECKYAVVREAVRGLKLGLAKESSEEWDLAWTDSAVTPEALARMKAYQKVNHFPGMYHLSRKNYLARNLNRMLKQFPADYDFYPRTWSLPAEYNELRQYLEDEANPVVIGKPEASCQGRGIFLSRVIEDFSFGEHYVVQKYVKKPFLIEGLKFDLRVYVLVTGCDPLRVHVYREGLARFATEVYAPPRKENLDNLCMHLTNYAINKGSAKFEFNSSAERMDVGHKRSLSSILARLGQLGHDSERVWRDICDTVTKTVISVQPVLAHTYRACQPDNLANNMCFEVLGFDVMLDHLLRPVMLEVNYTPSFATDTPLDATIKHSLLADTLRLINLTARAKHDTLLAKQREMMERTLTGKKLWRSKEERENEVRRLGARRDHWEERHMGNFSRIYPAEEAGKEGAGREGVGLLFERFLEHSEACYLAGTGANIKRQTKISLPCTPSPSATEAKSTFPQPKHTKADQLERIYMKKQRPIGGLPLKIKGNRSQLREEQMTDSRTASGHQPVGRDFVRPRTYDSVEKLGVWKAEGGRVNTVEKAGTREEGGEPVVPGKKGRSALSRVYNVAFKEMRAMKPTR